MRAQDPQTPSPVGATPQLHAGIAVVILAAGAGTRMKSALPKVLHSLCGRTLLSHAVHAAAELQPESLIVVVGHQREQVSAGVAETAAQLGREVRTAVQEEQNGTAHAVGCGLAQLPEGFTGTVLVTAGDVPLLDGSTLSALLDTHQRGSGAAVTVLTSTAPDPFGYGRIVRDASGDVVAIVEQKEATPEQQAITEVNSGVYAFDVSVLRAALAEVKADNTQGELYLTDVVAIARELGKTVRAAHVEDSVLVAGVNDKVQLAQLRAELNARIVRRWMLAGVDVIDPATTWIDVGARLSPDVKLRPNVQLLGSTTVGEGAEIGPDTTLADVEVGSGAVVCRTHGESSVIGANATVGPFAYLRPGSVLGQASKIGTFVETKNSQIGDHSKVPHLTYVGDATIGEHTNIGASSVFVNYDGVTKQRTVVGSYVKAGSDTMYVAPVTIGDGAYTGAGTILREDVPPGALAVSGGKQRNIEGWVEKNRPGTPSAEAAERARNSPGRAEDSSSDDS
jgi:bifunctional UDP-N-acetylglucosamine pyrophosphorylase/glucosamine-1-phosphate N-acetyltransferase